MKNKWTQYFLILLREWGLFILFITFFLLTRLFLWLPVQVDGHSMDPTLANNQRVIVLKPIDENFTTTESALCNVRENEPLRDENVTFPGLLMVANSRGLPELSSTVP